MFIAESQKSIYKLVHFAVISLNDFVSWNFEFVYFLLSSCLLCLYTNALGLNLLGLKGEKVTEVRI